MTGFGKRKRERIDDVTIRKNLLGAVDLFVTIPNKNGTNHTSHQLKTTQTKSIDVLLSRLQQTGYKYIALTHVVNDHPKDPDDRSDNVLPESCCLTLNGNKLVILRRLHVIVENLSDMTIFSPQSPTQQQLLSEYDLVSISPRSEAVFQAACTCDDIDIVTLDGTMSTSNLLPYKLRTTDIRSIRSRNATLEILYATPLLNRTARKGLVQTCQSVIATSFGVGNETTPSSTTPLIFSSGHRCTINTSDKRQKIDVGSTALRTKDDIVNLIHSVLAFDTKTAIASVTKMGHLAIEHGILRRRRQAQQLLANGSSRQAMKLCGTEIKNEQLYCKMDTLPCTTATIDQTSSLRNSSNETTIGKIEQINDHDHTHNDIGDDDDKEEEAFIAI
jgi:RNase P/RNase MRP subunit p30